MGSNSGSVTANNVIVNWKLDPKEMWNNKDYLDVYLKKGNYWVIGDLSSFQYEIKIEGRVVGSDVDTLIFKPTKSKYVSSASPKYEMPNNIKTIKITITVWGNDASV